MSMVRRWKNSAAARPSVSDSVGSDPIRRGIGPFTPVREPDSNTAAISGEIVIAKPSMDMRIHTITGRRHKPQTISKCVWPPVPRIA